MSNLSNSASSGMSASHLTTSQLGAHMAPAFAGFQFKTIGQTPDLLKRMAAGEVMNSDEYDSDRDELMSQEKHPQDNLHIENALQSRSLRERMSIPAESDVDERSMTMTTRAQPLDLAHTVSVSNRESAFASETNSRNMDVETVPVKNYPLPGSLRSTADVSSGVTPDHRAESVPSHGSQKSSKMPDNDYTFRQGSSKNSSGTFHMQHQCGRETAHTPCSVIPQDVQTDVAGPLVNSTRFNVSDALSLAKGIYDRFPEMEASAQNAYNQAEEICTRIGEAYTRLGENWKVAQESKEFLKEYVTHFAILRDGPGEVLRDYLQLDQMRTQMQRELEQAQLKRMKPGSAPPCQAGPSSHTVPSARNTCNSPPSPDATSSVRSHLDMTKKLKLEKERVKAELAAIEEKERVFQKAAEEKAGRQQQIYKNKREGALKKVDDQRAKQRQAHIQTDAEQACYAQEQARLQAQREKEYQDSLEKDGLERQKRIEDENTRIREAELRQELKKKDLQKQLPHATGHQHAADSDLFSQATTQTLAGSQRPQASNKEDLLHKTASAAVFQAVPNTFRDGDDRGAAPLYPTQSQMSGGELTVAMTRTTSSAISGGVPVSFGGRLSSLSIPQSKNVRPMAQALGNHPPSSASPTSPIIKRDDTVLGGFAIGVAPGQKGLQPSAVSNGKMKLVQEYDVTHSKVQDATNHISSSSVSQRPIPNAAKTQSKHARNLTAADSRGVSATVEGEHEDIKPVIKVERDPTPISIPPPENLQVPNGKANEYAAFPTVTHVVQTAEHNIPPLSLPSPDSQHFKHGEPSHGPFVLHNPPTLSDIPVGSHTATRTSPVASVFPAQSSGTRERSPGFQPLDSRMTLPEMRNGTDLLARVAPGPPSSGNGWLQGHVPNEQARHKQTRTQLPQRPIRRNDHWSPDPQSQPRLSPRGDRRPSPRPYPDSPASDQPRDQSTRSLSRELEWTNSVSRPLTPEPSHNHQGASHRLSHKRKRTDPMINELPSRRPRYERQHEPSYVTHPESAEWSYSATFSRSPTPESPHHAIPLHMRLGEDDDGKYRAGANNPRYGGPSKQQQPVQNQWSKQDSVRSDAYNNNNHHTSNRGMRARGRGTHYQPSNFRNNNNRVSLFDRIEAANDIP